MRYSYRSSSVVWILIAVNVFVYFITSLNPDVEVNLALFKPILYSNYWSIFTAMFVHANFTHILFNMLTLYFFGTFCLQLIDTKWFLAVYFIGGIAGNLLFLLIGPEFSAVVGASGAIFALGGVLLAMRPTVRVYLYFFIPMPLWVMIIIGFLITAFDSSVAWQAHLGGLAVGILFGLYFRWKETRKLGPGYYRW
jgi:uncharacterized protein